MSFHISPSKIGSNIWIANKIIGRYQPKNPRQKVIIADLYSNPLRNRKVVDAAKFFPSFCRVLGKNEIGSVFVYDIDSMERNTQDSVDKHILINLISERKINPAYNIPSSILKKFNLVFNSYSLAETIRNKKVTNEFLSSCGVPVPRAQSSGTRIFSMEKIERGRHDTAIVVDASDKISVDRYNTEFIDTRVQFENNSYYTCVRIMCIGSRVVKFVVQARSCREQCVEVRDVNTPLDLPLIRYLHVKLVKNNLGKLLSLAEKAGSAYGAGFYAHDVVIDKDSGDPYICETELKFFPDAYTRKFRGLLDNENALFNTVSWKEYAKTSAIHFLEYLEDIERTPKMLPTH